LLSRPDSVAPQNLTYLNTELLRAVGHEKIGMFTVRSENPLPTKKSRSLLDEKSLAHFL